MTRRSRFHLSVLTALATTALAMLLPSYEAQAQQFGKNKVQYRDFDWKYIQSVNFDIYFYDSAGVHLARFAAEAAEAALQKIQSNWRYRITQRISIVVYNSHNHFQQTNVVTTFMPEGVGGVTELFKNRIVVPFEGEWDKFRHVIHHELVHAVLNDKFYGGSVQNLISYNIRFMLPGWMNEGLAEFESHDGYDIETDMFIRDAVIGAFLPDLERLDGYFAYRGGQAFYWYVEQHYGRQKIAELLNRLKTTGNLDAAFKGAFKKSVEEFSEQWQYDLKKIYWPDVADRKRAIDVATLLTNHKKDDSFFNTSPAISPNGDKLAYISDRDGYRSVYVMEVQSGDLEKIAQGESDVEFEELHLLTPAIAWSPDSRRVGIAVKSRGHDAIYLIDVESNDREKLEFPHLDAIYSVDWSPDGQQIAFQGIQGEQSDIFVYDLKSRVLRNLTEDVFSDLDPNWSADSRTVYFVSDRGEYPVRTVSADSMPMWQYDIELRDLYAIEVASGALRRVTSTPDVRESSPVATRDGALLFISNANGIGNIYRADTAGGSVRPITNSISGIEQLSLTRDGSRLVFTTWNTDGQDIFQMRMPLEARVPGDTLTPTVYLQRAGTGDFAGADSASGSEEPIRAVTELKGYGNVRLDVSEAAPAAPHGEDDPAALAASPAPPADSRTGTGDYVVKDYRVRFTTDLMTATGNYSSFYGVQGVAQMLFSDMLGDHQIYVATNLQLDLKNSDFVVTYSYLPETIDYRVALFQDAQLMQIEDDRGFPKEARFRQYGITGQAANPFDRFRRLEVAATWLTVSREMIYSVDDVQTLEDQSKMLFVPSLSYIFDNSAMWAFGPITGSRYNLSASASPKFGEDGVGFYTLLGDMRTYAHLGGEYSLAFRAAGGFSFGPDPQRFFIGGVDGWWLNYAYTPGTRLPLQDAEDFTFLTPGYPLRGFDFNAQSGSKYFLGNFEFRFPLFRALVSGPLPLLFQYVSGVMFLDVGSAWTDNFNAFSKRPDGSVVADDLLMGTGIGARAYFLGLPVRFDVAWNFDLERWSKPQYYISLGYDF